MIAGGQIGSAALVAGVGAGLALAFTSDRACWVVYVASTTASGQSLTLGPVTILPEHVVLVVVGIRALGQRSERSGRSTRRLKLGQLAFLLTLWSVLNLAVSIIMAPEPEQSLRLLIWTFTNIVALAFLFRWQMPVLTMVRDGLGTLVVLYAVYLVQWAQANATGTQNLTVDVDYASDAFRAKGLMLEPNLLAALALLWLAVAYAYRRELSVQMLFLSVAVLGAGILATYTRVSMVGFAIVGTLLIWEMTQRRQKGSANVRMFIWVAALGLIVWQLATPAYPASTGEADGILSALTVRIANLLQFSTGTAAFRLDAVSVALTEIFRGEWLGHGYNSFPQTHFNPFTSDGRSYIGVLWVALLYDGGIFGLLIFLAMFALAWRAAPAGSWPFFLCFVLVSTATNPIWYAFPWLTLALILKRGLGGAHHLSRAFEEPRLRTTAERP